MPPVGLSSQTPRLAEQTKKQLVQLAKDHGSISRQEAQASLGTSSATCDRLLRDMVHEGLLAMLGKGRRVVYVPRGA